MHQLVNHVLKCHANSLAGPIIDLCDSDSDCDSDPVDGPINTDYFGLNSPPSPWEDPQDPRLFSDSDDDSDNWSDNDVMEVEAPPREIVVIDLSNE